MQNLSVIVIIIKIRSSSLKIKNLLSKKPFSIVGHRGAKGVKPENTIPAIEYGIKSGADIIEVDVRRTKDNHIITRS